MKRCYFIGSSLLLLVLLMSFGWHSFSQTPAAAPEETEAACQPAEPEAAAPLIVNDDFSNLPPADPTQPVYDRYTIRERKQQGLPLKLPEIQPYSAEKIVYLTFDDGPDAKNTPAVLDILKASGSKATFFVLGKKAELQPAILQRIYQEGHAIGNHSYDHVYAKLYASPAAYIQEIDRTDAIIQSIIGVRPLINRAPGGTAGHFTKAFSAALTASGYLEYGWNISTADAAPNHPVAQDFIDNVLAQLEAHPYLASHAIVLMHSSEDHEETVKALPRIIQIFKERGYNFGVITPMTPSAW